ncbi:MAG: hypothetical protein A3F67_03055 [Verrucomicrobia bacterium RIFCSPHIGHO2_12_FULL_41_10]|nr:MAG: hypothetical protein A3F67_03055 [Verrucomicrobia bacterium RIFCSPHIGHO2_12_FULL_41_10]
MPEDIKEILNHLIFSPDQDKIQIDFDLREKFFILSIPIYEAKRMTKSVEKYVEVRNGKTFKPHATSFLKEGKKVYLVQKIPFQWGFRPGIRKDILDFLQLAKRCHHFLYEIALEEQYRMALDSLVAE